MTMVTSTDPTPLRHPTPPARHARRPGRRPRPRAGRPQPRSRPTPSRASATAASPTRRPRSRRTTTRSPPSPTASRRKADAASGAAAEVLTASAGLARDKGLRGAVRKHLRAGEDLLAAVHAAVEQFAAVFTGMGGLMAERVTDLRDIERRVVAHLVGEPEPGRPHADGALGAGRRGPRAAPTPRAWTPRSSLALVTERGGPTSHTAIIARQLGIPCVVGTAGAMTRRGGTRAAGRRHRRHGRDRARRGAGRRAGRRRPRAARGAGVLVRARARPPTARRSSCWPTSPTATPPAPPRDAPVEGVGLFRTELCFLNRKEEPSVEEQADIYAEVLARRSATGPVRRGPHARRGLGQAGRVRHPRGRGEPRARRARAAAVLRQPRPARAPARRDRRRGRARPAPRPG